MPQKAWTCIFRDILGLYFTVNNRFGGEGEKWLLFLPPAPLGFASLLFSFLGTAAFAEWEVLASSHPIAPGTCPSTAEHFQVAHEPGNCHVPPISWKSALSTHLSHSNLPYWQSRTKFAVCWNVQQNIVCIVGILFVFQMALGSEQKSKGWVI